VVLAAQRGEVAGVPDPSEPCRELEEFAARFKTQGTCE
jgi:hypothetical protein